MRVMANPAFGNRHQNPYNWLLYTHLKSAGIEVHEYSRSGLLNGQYDIWHIHWPEMHLGGNSWPIAVCRVLFRLALVRLARSRGVKIIWTIHNLGSHERSHPTLDRWFLQAFVRQLDGYICLSHSGQRLALERFPDLHSLPGHVVPHGHYKDAYPNTISREEARARLGIDLGARVIGYVGLIRDYKGIPELLAAFRAIRDPDKVLLIAGEPQTEKLKAVIQSMATGDPRIRLHLGFVADDELQLYLNAADLVALPYRAVLNSGSAVLALSFDRPVLVPRRGALGELQELVGREWVRTFEGEITGEELLRASGWALPTRTPQQAPLDSLAWNRLAAQTAAAYEDVLGWGRYTAPGAASAQDRRRAGNEMPMLLQLPEKRAKPGESLPPLVSVITPCYNAAAFVAETIESVRAQTYANLEHIVVDDGSTDGSWEVLQSYGESIRAVRLEQNRGGSHARNRGAALARGEFLMFLDADDVIAPETIAALVAAVREQPGAIAFCAWRRLRQIEGQWRTAPAEVPLPTAGTDYFRGWIERSWGAPPCTVLWRREVYESTGGWDEDLTVEQDTDLLLRALLDGASLIRAPNGMAYYRAHGDSRISVCNDIFSTGRVRSQMRVLEKLSAQLERRGSLQEYEVPIGNYYRQLTLLAFQQDNFRTGLECLRRAEQYIGHMPISRTAFGRLLERLLGVERKERLVQGLARWGIAKGQRRRFVRLRKQHLGKRGNTPVAAASETARLPSHNSPQASSGC